jgi:hypothetical protein
MFLYVVVRFCVVFCVEFIFTSPIWADLEVAPPYGSLAFESSGHPVGVKVTGTNARPIGSRAPIRPRQAEVRGSLRFRLRTGNQPGLIKEGLGHLSGSS